MLSRNETQNIGNFGSTPTTSYNAQMNRWIALFHNPDNPSYGYAHKPFRGSTSAEVNAYNDSIFALKIPQGVEADQRIGAEINILKDKWKFEFYFNNNNPTNTTIAASGVEPRLLKIRLMGIFQPVLMEPGNIGYTSEELFEEIDRLESHFKRGDAQGYRKVYDKTLNLGVYDANSSSVDKAVLGPTKAVFAGNFSYKRRYAITSTGDATIGDNQSGNKVGTEITYDTATGITTLEGGTSHGQLLWYVFVEDMYPRHDTVTQNQWYYLQYGLGCRIDRRTYWQDA